MLKDNPQNSVQDDLYRARLSSIIDLRHELVKLAGLVEWECLKSDLASFYCAGQGRPGGSIRLMAGLCFLKDLKGLPDEEVCEVWRENPYFQYFCGEDYFQHRLPVEPPSLSIFRKRIGEKGAQRLLEETIKPGRKTGAVKDSEINRINAGTTVQEKAIKFPADTQLCHKAREELVKTAKHHEVALRQSYVRKSKHALYLANRFMAARHVKKGRAMIRKVRNYLGRVVRGIEREAFRSVLDKALARKDNTKGGRPPYDAVLMFKALVLQALYNLSDEETEFQILDRLTFMRFLGLELHDDVPDARTVWGFREKLIEAEAVEKLFAQFDTMLNDAGFAASGGQIIDATFVEVPRQRNNRDDNETIKKREVPADWSANKKAQKDTDARWTKKNGLSYFGYKNHVNADRKHKLIRTYIVTDASVHDSQELEHILDPNNDCQEIWADSAYRSEEQEASLLEEGRTSHIHERAYRDKPLTAEQEVANTERSRVRVRVEHIFGHIETAMHGCFVRTIGFARAQAKIGMENLAYNISRFSFLMRDANTTTAPIS